MGEGFKVGVAGASEQFFDKVFAENAVGRDNHPFAGHHPTFWKLHASRKVGTGKVGRECLASVESLLVR